MKEHLPKLALTAALALGACTNRENTPPVPTPPTPTMEATNATPTVEPTHQFTIEDGLFNTAVINFVLPETWTPYLLTIETETK